MENDYSWEDESTYIEDSVIELLEKIYDKELKSQPKLIFQFHRQLNTKIKCLSKNTEEYKNINKYVENTHGPTHKFHLDIRNIYKVQRKGEFSNFQSNIGNRKLLWHGTRLSNYKSILKNGLLIDHPNGSKTAKMFGKGIYFADIVTKAAQYCCVDVDADIAPSGILILADVALGQPIYKTKSENITSLPVGKNSVNGLGIFRPDKLKSFHTDYGVEIPLGTLDRENCKNNFQSDLTYSEYVVYNINQIFLRYLVLVDFYGLCDCSSG